MKGEKEETNDSLAIGEVRWALRGYCGSWGR